MHTQNAPLDLSCWKELGLQRTLGFHGALPQIWDSWAVCGECTALTWATALVWNFQSALLDVFLQYNQKTNIKIYNNDRTLSKNTLNIIFGLDKKFWSVSSHEIPQGKYSASTACLFGFKLTLWFFTRIIFSITQHACVSHKAGQRGSGCVLLRRPRPSNVLWKNTTWLLIIKWLSDVYFLHLHLNLLVNRKKCVIWLSN